MRPHASRPAILVLAAFAVPIAGGALAAPAVAQTPPDDACAERLDTGERRTYRFENGSRSLSWARLVVTPTRADEDRYCVEVRFGGRKPFHEASTTGYERRNGRWVQIGGDGGGGEPMRSYTQTVQLRAKRRSDRHYDVRVDGRWYRATASLRNP